MLKTPTSRRNFLKDSSIAAAAAVALGACKEEPKPAPTRTPASTGGTMGAHETASAGGVVETAADKMDAMHEAGVKAFPAKTAIWGNQLLKPRMDGAVKVWPGLIGGWVMKGTPSIAFGVITPCQWTAVLSGNWFVTLTRIVSPSVTRISGPGTTPL